MTCYKLVEVEFKWRIIGGKVEQFIQDVSKKFLIKTSSYYRDHLIYFSNPSTSFLNPFSPCFQTERRLFTTIHRQIFCTHFEWCNMNMADIRALEDKTKEELDKVKTRGFIVVNSYKIYTQ